MDLVSHVQAWVAVVDEGGFTRAAEALGVPQPVVSRRVAALERRLGGRLVTRGRQVAATDLGALLLPHARGVLGRVDQLLAAAAGHGAELLLAVPPGADPRGLADVRTAARAGAAGSLVLVEAAAADRATALAAGEVHAAVLACPADVAVATTGLGAAGSAPDHPGHAGRALHLESLRRRGPTGRPAVLRLTREDDVAWLRDPLVRAAARAGLAPAQVGVETTRTAVLTDVHDTGDLLLCSRQEALIHGLAWAPVAGLDLRRGWRIEVSERAAGADRLVALLPDVVGPLAGALGCGTGVAR